MQGKQEQRAAMEPVLSALDLSARRKIEEVAERIVLLSDGAGQDVIAGISQDIVGDDAKAAFAAAYAKSEQLFQQSRLTGQATAKLVAVRQPLCP